MPQCTCNKVTDDTDAGFKITQTLRRRRLIVYYYIDHIRWLLLREPVSSSDTRHRTGTQTSTPRQPTIIQYNSSTRERSVIQWTLSIQHFHTIVEYKTKTLAVQGSASLSTSNNSPRRREDREWRLFWRVPSQASSNTKSVGIRLVRHQRRSKHRQLRSQDSSCSSSKGRWWSTTPECPNR